MSDREYFSRRAATEREAALKAASMASFRAHMAMAREYDWRAATEPYADSAPVLKLRQR